MNTVIITIGRPGSGKSTWAKELIEKDPSYFRVNRDSIREMIGHKSQWYTNDFEVMVSKLQNEIIMTYLANRRNIVIDDCFCKQKRANEVIDVVQKYVDGNGYPVNFKQVVFDTPHDVCVERDSKRFGTACVGEDIILQFGKDFNAGVASGWIKNKTTTIVKRSLDAQDKTLPLGVIFDIDGTLADISHRGPYNTELCLGDSLKENVANILHMYHSFGYKIIITSGRFNQFRGLTEQWLREYGIPFDYLYMREDGNISSDSKIKKSFYENHIKNQFYIECVFDDRNRVVDMWREQGLTCCQVAFGNF